MSLVVVVLDVAGDSYCWWSFVLNVLGDSCSWYCWWLFMFLMIVVLDVVGDSSFLDFFEIIHKMDHWSSGKLLLSFSNHKFMGQTAVYHFFTRFTTLQITSDPSFSPSRCDTTSYQKKKYDVQGQVLYITPIIFSSPMCITWHSKLQEQCQNQADVVNVRAVLVIAGLFMAQ